MIEELTQEQLSDDTIAIPMHDTIRLIESIRQRLHDAEDAIIAAKQAIDEIGGLR